MCDYCNVNNFICLKCGAINGENRFHLTGYVFPRIALKKIQTREGVGYFVWVLVKGLDINKIGCGEWSALVNETKPNANYAQFDRAIVYWVGTDYDMCKAFATQCIGELKPAMNKVGKKNNIFIHEKELRLPAMDKVSREVLLSESCFEINGLRYYDAQKVNEIIGRRSI